MCVYNPDAVKRRRSEGDVGVKHVGTEAAVSASSPTLTAVSKRCPEGFRAPRFEETFPRKNIKTRSDSFSISYPTDGAHE